MDDRRVGRLVRAARLKKGLRQSDVEAACGLDQTTVSRLEVGRLNGLTVVGWTVLVEYTFSHYGERGSVDIVAWQAATRTLLIVEIKTRLLDVQELLSTLDRKCRVVPQLLVRERRWIPAAVGRLVVAEDAAAARRVVRSHAATFDTALPSRTRHVRSWIAEPLGNLAGIWFLSSTRRGHTDRTRRAGSGAS